ncbi:MAG: amino acid ABC transporter ATPase [Candidatus Entotheonella factor]|uniref:Amino acid ABC transporter ATPase n=1 Tax=Entotheonella factor TaxID=1429438 RepID=W4LP93_ENTF1|nr:ABC transporter ATP-binding protein [Candidatus Entotheonella palauensis]ETW99231.1 MAG: amino acid ABC transporter ATPase [Candidatus Entotheonella factor]
MLTMNNVETYYGNIRALKGVSLAVPEGSTVTLLGSNGAGKSTTLKTISGLVPAASGTIEFMNQRIDHLAPERIVRLGISHVPEGREVFKELTVAENLKMGAYTRRDKREIEASYESVYSLYPVLKERRLQLAGTLSGGEQQMLAIGRALMGRPKLLLLDEPSLGLAPKLVEEIFSVIERINQEGMTVLLVEQNANKALGIAEYGYVLETGTIALEDRASRLLENDHVRRSYLGE